MAREERQKKRSIFFLSAKEGECCMRDRGRYGGREKRATQERFRGRRPRVAFSSRKRVGVG